MDRKKVAIQGSLASFHDAAAQRYFSADEIDLVECRTFLEVCDAVYEGLSEYAVMAIENTLAGSLLPNYMLLSEFPLQIIGEQYLHIEQNLMALPGQAVEDLSFVHSHPIALQQCAQFLAGHPNLTPIEKYDTAASAAEIVAEGLQGVAAIASVEAAKQHGLDILAQSIEDNKENQTRFLILVAQDHPPVVQPNKASLCFETAHEAGALAKTLDVFSRNQINLTKIQSVPLVGRPYTYQFHVDMVWNGTSDMERALREVEKVTRHLRVLGMYQKGDQQ
jgi:prephenate dehydratase